jgi:cobaltochelatase CobS
MTDNTDTRITCSICGARVHSIQLHLRDEHPETSLEDYKRSFPDDPLMSEMAMSRLASRRVAPLKTEMAGVATSNVVDFGASKRAPMHEVFGLGNVKAALNARGEAIPISIVNPGAFSDMVPKQDAGYIFNIDLLKTVLLGLELKIPVYLWGHAGVGKSTVLEQVCARTNRPYMRIQHTINTEEAHIVGQTLANASGTYFEPGPLALAMRHGWTYNADEYDYAHASVLSVYQAILEGKPLVIKEAPTEWRVVHPHPEFRFVATGNTNGSGDEEGLYAGTNIGNAANYSRFGIVERVEYMPRNQEIMVLVNQSGITKEDAGKLVDFAKAIRDSYEASKMSATIGPRELIYAGMIGLRRGSWRTGLSLAFINRLGKVDRETADGVAQRIFG